MLSDLLVSRCLLAEENHREAFVVEVWLWGSTSSAELWISWQWLFPPATNWRKKCLFHWRKQPKITSLRLIRSHGLFDVVHV